MPGARVGQFADDLGIPREQAMGIMRRAQMNTGPGYNMAQMFVEGGGVSVGRGEDSPSAARDNASSNTDNSSNNDDDNGGIIDSIVDFFTGGDSDPNVTVDQEQNMVYDNPIGPKAPGFFDQLFQGNYQAALNQGVGNVMKNVVGLGLMGGGIPGLIAGSALMRQDVPVFDYNKDYTQPENDLFNNDDNNDTSGIMSQYQYDPNAPLPLWFLRQRGLI